ncbi:hypothetical protein Tco_0481321 [Tanacetum coccineum]
MEFQVGDRVMLKVSPWKRVVHFGKLGKLNPRYVGPFKVTEKIGSVAYKLELPQELSRVHNTFHVSNLKKCYSDEPLAIPLEGLHIDDKLQFVEEPGGGGVVGGGVELGPFPLSGFSMGYHPIGGVAGNTVGRGALGGGGIWLEVIRNKGVGCGIVCEDLELQQWVGFDSTDSVGVWGVGLKGRRGGGDRDFKMYLWWLVGIFGVSGVNVVGGVWSRGGVWKFLVGGIPFGLAYCGVFVLGYGCGRLGGAWWISGVKERCARVGGVGGGGGKGGGGEDGLWVGVGKEKTQVREAKEGGGKGGQMLEGQQGRKENKSRAREKRRRKGMNKVRIGRYGRKRSRQGNVTEKTARGRKDRKKRQARTKEGKRMVRCSEKEIEGVRGTTQKNPGRITISRTVEKSWDKKIEEGGTAGVILQSEQGIKRGGGREKRARSREKFVRKSRDRNDIEVWDGRESKEGGDMKKEEIIKDRTGEEYK